MQIFVLTQPSSAIAKDIYINCGGRPKMVRGFTSGEGQWWKVDGKQDNSETVYRMTEGAPDTETNVCQLKDYGFVLGSDGDVIRKNSAVIIIEAYLEGETADHRARSVTLNSAKIGTGDDVWTDPSKSYAYSDGDEDFLDWIRKEA